MAIKLKRYTDKGGLEATVSGLGTILLLLSIVGSLTVLLASTNAFFDDSANNGFPAVWVIVAMAALFQGIVAFVILRALAEVVRLLKKVAGVPYGGRISTPRSEIVCSDCHTPVEAWRSKCRNCMADFENGDG